MKGATSASPLSARAPRRTAYRGRRTWNQSPIGSQVLAFMSVPDHAFTYFSMASSSLSPTKAKMRHRLGDRLRTMTGAEVLGAGIDPALYVFDTLIARVELEDVQVSDSVGLADTAFRGERSPRRQYRSPSTNALAARFIDAPERPA